MIRFFKNVDVLERSFCHDANTHMLTRSAHLPADELCIFLVAIEPENALFRIRGGRCSPGEEEGGQQ